MNVNLNTPFPTSFNQCDEDVCPICLSDITPNTKIIQLDLCGHIFCSSCDVEEKYFSKPNTCPYCRVPTESMLTELREDFDLFDEIKHKDEIDRCVLELVESIEKNLREKNQPQLSQFDSKSLNFFEESIKDAKKETKLFSLQLGIIDTIREIKTKEFGAIDLATKKSEKLKIQYMRITEFFIKIFDGKFSKKITGNQN